MTTTASPSSSPSGTTFADHFSVDSATYKRLRPSYPDAVYEWILAFLSQARGGDGSAHDETIIVDVGCGPGVATYGIGAAALRAGLPGVQVHGLDPSSAQIEAADAATADRAHVHFHVAAAEALHTIVPQADVIMGAAALHWFDHDVFWPNAYRTLKPSGVVVFFTYSRTSVDDGGPIDIASREIGEVMLKEYWPPQTAYVWAQYRTVPFPFEAKEDVQPMHVRKEVTMDEFIGYMCTWSASNRWAQKHGRSPRREMVDILSPVWGAPDLKRVVTWPLHFVAAQASSYSGAKDTNE